MSGERHARTLLKPKTIKLSRKELKAPPSVPWCVGGPAIYGKMRGQHRLDYLRNYLAAAQSSYASSVECLLQDYMGRLATRLSVLETELRYAWRALDLLSHEYIKMWDRLEKLELLLYEQQSVISQLLDIYSSSHDSPRSRELQSPQAIADLTIPSPEGNNIDDVRVDDCERNSSSENKDVDGIRSCDENRRHSNIDSSEIVSDDDSGGKIPDDEAFYRSLNNAHRDTMSQLSESTDQELSFTDWELSEQEGQVLEQDILGIWNGEAISSPSSPNDPPRDEVYTAFDYKEYKGNSPCVSDHDLAELDQLSVSLTRVECEHVKARKEELVDSKEHSSTSIPSEDDISQSPDPFIKNYTVYSHQALQDETINFGNVDSSEAAEGADGPLSLKSLSMDGRSLSSTPLSNISDCTKFSQSFPGAHCHQADSTNANEPVNIYEFIRESGMEFVRPTTQQITGKLQPEFCVVVPSHEHSLHRNFVDEGAEGFSHPDASPNAGSSKPSYRQQRYSRSHHHHHHHCQQEVEKQQYEQLHAFSRGRESNNSDLYLYHLPSSKPHFSRAATRSAKHSQRGPTDDKLDFHANFQDSPHKSISYDLPHPKSSKFPQHHALIQQAVLDYGSNQKLVMSRSTGSSLSNTSVGKISAPTGMKYDHVVSCPVPSGVSSRARTPSPIQLVHTKHRNITGSLLSMESILMSAAADATKQDKESQQRSREALPTKQQLLHDVKPSDTLNSFVPSKLIVSDSGYITIACDPSEMHISGVESMPTEKKSSQRYGKIVSSLSSMLPSLGHLRRINSSHSLVGGKHSVFNALRRSKSTRSRSEGSSPQFDRSSRKSSIVSTFSGFLLRRRRRHRVRCSSSSLADLSQSEGSKTDDEEDEWPTVRTRASQLHRQSSIDSTSTTDGDILEASNIKAMFPMIGDFANSKTFVPIQDQTVLNDSTSSMNVSPREFAVSRALSRYRQRQTSSEVESRVDSIPSAPSCESDLSRHFVDYDKGMNEPPYDPQVNASTPDSIVSTSDFGVEADEKTSDKNVTSPLEIELQASISASQSSLLKFPYDAAIPVCDDDEQAQTYDDGVTSCNKSSLLLESVASSPGDTAEFLTPPERRGSGGSPAIECGLVSGADADDMASSLKSMESAFFSVASDSRNSSFFHSESLPEMAVADESGASSAISAESAFFSTMDERRELDGIHAMTSLDEQEVPDDLHLVVVPDNVVYDERTLESSSPHESHHSAESSETEGPDEEPEDYDNEENEDETMDNDGIDEMLEEEGVNSIITLSSKDSTSTALLEDINNCQFSNDGLVKGTHNSQETSSRWKLLKALRDKSIEEKKHAEISVRIFQE